jgi:hypothetical protein
MIREWLVPHHLVDNADRVKANWEKYRRRQAIVEPACPNDVGQVGRHPFGTIKRSWAILTPS